MRSSLVPDANASFTAELLVRRSIGEDIKSTARRSSIALWRSLLTVFMGVWRRVLHICGIPGMISIPRDHGLLFATCFEEFGAGVGLVGMGCCRFLLAARPRSVISSNLKFTQIAGTV